MVKSAKTRVSVPLAGRITETPDSKRSRYVYYVADSFKQLDGRLNEYSFQVNIVQTRAENEIAKYESIMAEIQSNTAKTNSTELPGNEAIIKDVEFTAQELNVNSEVVNNIRVEKAQEIYNP